MTATKKKPKRHEEENTTSKTEKNNASIWVAIITGVVSITLGILGFPPLVTYLNAQWNNTPTPQPTEAIFLVPSETPVFSILTIATPQETNIVTPTITTTPTSTFEPISGVMNAQISYNYSTGNAPLNVSFNAHASYVSYPDGQKVECQFENVCTYTWDVRTKEGKTISSPTGGPAEFSYTFSKKGEYMVVVYVCRGDVCNFSAANIVVK